MGLSSRSGTRGGCVLRGWQGKGGKFWLGNIKKGEKCEKSGHRLEVYLGIKIISGFYSSVITMMHGPINITLAASLYKVRRTPDIHLSKSQPYYTGVLISP